MKFLASWISSRWLERLSVWIWRLTWGEWELREIARAKVFNLMCMELGEDLTGREELVWELCDIFGVEQWGKDGEMATERREKMEERIEKIEKMELNEFEFMSLKSLRSTVELLCFSRGVVIGDEIGEGGGDREKLIALRRRLKNEAREEEEEKRKGRWGGGEGSKITTTTTLMTTTTRVVIFISTKKMMKTKKMFTNISTNEVERTNERQTDGSFGETIHRTLF